MEYKTLQSVAHLFHHSIESSRLVTGVAVDTRVLQSGNLFFALKGDKVDGHQFLKEAAAKGAVAAVVSHAYQGPHFDLPLLRVEDPLHALQEYAKHVLAHRHVRIVAITGSIGKTTTKDFVKTLLGVKYRVMASPGNSNSQIGLPLAILNSTTGQEEILVLEMGMTHPGNLLRLVQIAPPELAVITKIALVHACNFDSLEEIAWAKSEIFSHPKTRLGIIPREIPNYTQLVNLKQCHKCSFSVEHADADYYLNLRQSNLIHAHIEKKTVDIGSFPILGKHNLYNFMIAAMVARHFNISWEEIIATIPALQLPERRLQFVEHKGISFLNDSYNASELSVKAALETLPSPKTGGKKIAVLGSMMELGKFSLDCHTRVGEFALSHVEGVYCLGEECRPIFDIFKKAGKSAALFLNRAELVEHLKKVLKPSDVVLLKGSRSKELWKVLEEL